MTEYIVCDMRPLSTVEKPSFKTLDELLSGTKLKTRKTLSKQINEMYEKMQTEMESQLTQVSFECTIADLWSVNNQGYLGMTAHWINRDFTRRSASLTCRRITRSLTYDVVGRAICDIHTQYELDVAKLTHTVTNEASNFSKAFTEFGKKNEEESDEGSESEQETSDEVIFHDLQQILANTAFETGTDADDTIITLPEQLKYISHTLNFITTTDADKALLNKAYGRIHHPAMAKCQAI